MDGLNLFRMVWNNPLTNVDGIGLFNLNVHSWFKDLLKVKRVKNNYREMMNSSLWNGMIKVISLFNRPQILAPKKFNMKNMTKFTS